MSAQVLRFVVPGRPVPKGRPRVTATRGTYTPPATKRFEQLVAGAALAAMTAQGFRRCPAGVDVVLDIDVATDTQGGDIDNHAKAVLDGLNGIAYADDRQVRRLVVEIVRRVRPDQVGTTVEIRRIPQPKPPRSVERRTHR